jgi:small-conductance mechanosensitive channel
MPTPDPAILTELSETWAAVVYWVSGHSRRIALALVIGALLVALLYGLRSFGKKLSQAPGNVGKWRGVLGRALASMSLWFMVALAAQIVAAYAIAPPELAGTIRVFFVIAAVLQAAIMLRELVLGIVEIRASGAETDTNLGSALGLIRLLVTVVLMVIAVVVILANLGVNVTGLLAGLGIGGIAIGLAAQGIFSDLFAALSILFDQPFRKGDLIRWDAKIGTVEAIGLKSSRIRALSGEEIIVSNANLLNKELHNFARVEVRRVNQPLGLVYHTPLDLCERLGAILEPAIEACEGCTFARCGMESFGASSLEFMLVYDIVASDQADVLERRNLVNLAVLRALNDNKIALAYPTQTTYTAGPDGSLVMPYAQPLQTDIVKRKK